jgi:mRNA-degrading endonuclease toxin of MazEF toxin-antitoxin module
MDKVIARGEIYLVNFDPTIGSEIRKTRPALIIQNKRTQSDYDYGGNYVKMRR